MPYSLCTTYDIPDPGSKGFEIDTGFARYEIFVVHKDGQYFGYKNSCPHTGATLEWQEDQFLDMDSSYIQCSTHDALFDIESGNCISGPCAGDHLTPITLKIDNNVIYAEPG